MIRIWDGYVTIWMRGEEAERFFNLCVRRGIELWQIEAKEDGYSLKMRVKDFFLIKDLSRKTKIKLRIVQKGGWNFWWKKQTKRAFFWLGGVICILLLWFASGCLWSVRIEGNDQLSRDMIMDFLQNEGVSYGMRLTDIPIAEMEMKFREDYGEINWVSLSVEGTVLHVRLKENDVSSYQEAEGMIGDLVSPINGIVKKILVREGTALVKVGEEVKQGEILIEGKVSIPDENGELKKTVYCQGDGDVWIQTDVLVQEDLPIDYQKRVYSGAREKKVFWEIAGQKLGLDMGRIDYEQYDVIEERENLSILGEIELPISKVVKVYREYTMANAKYSKEEGEVILAKRLEKIIQSLEKKGVQIMEKDVRIVADNASISLKGRVRVLWFHDHKQQMEGETRSR